MHMHHSNLDQLSQNCYGDRFAGKALPGFRDPGVTFFGDQRSSSVVISELGMLYHDASPDADATSNHSRVHIRALANGSLDSESTLGLPGACNWYMLLHDW